MKEKNKNGYALYNLEEEAKRFGFFSVPFVARENKLKLRRHLGSVWTVPFVAAACVCESNCDRKSSFLATRSRNTFFSFPFFSFRRDIFSNEINDEITLFFVL